MKEKKSYNYKIVYGIILGILLTGISVAAATKYKSNTVFYNNSNSTLTSGDVQGAIDELNTKINNSTTCPNGYVCLTKKDTLAVGDYVKMTPTKSSYTTDTSKTGYSSTQTINPQELNLWRVISLNSDGTVDVISAHTSTTEVYFSGKTGYQNLVGYLNVLASQYENSTYTKGSRYFGYNGQTEYITDTSKFTNQEPWTCSTGESCNPVESQGGGDELYQKDYDLVKNAIGTLKATNVKGLSSLYWIASRFYGYKSTTTYSWGGCLIDSLGSSDDSVYNSDMYYYSNSSFRESSNSRALRPIVTLKSGLKYLGVGTEDYPMEISTS